MNKLRVAVVGAGRLGGFHAQKLAALDDVELVAVADPSEDARNRVAAQCRARAVADFREVLGAVDAAVVAVPTRMHHAVGMELLGRGVHCLIEKPLAATLAEADDLVAAARRGRALLQVGHVERFNPAIQSAAPHVRNPKYIEAVRASGFTFRSTDIGAVLDLMIHDIDLVLSLVRAPVRRVEALGLSVLGGHEDVANARIEFATGCVASLSASRVSYEAVRRMHVWAPRGFASIDFATRKTRIVRPSEALLLREFDVDRLAADDVENLKTRLAEVHLPQEDIEAAAVDALALEIRDFVDSIRQGRPPRVSGQQGRDAVALADEILAKIASHAWDDQPDGLVGPMAAPGPSVIPAPHWHFAPRPSADRRKAAG